MSAVMSAPSTQDKGDAGDGALLSSLSGRIEPVKVSPMYQLGLAAVAVVMVILPLVYVSLVCLAGYAVCWYAVHGLSVFEEVGRSSGKGALLLYVSPLAVGVVLVAFMIKPLFAKRAQRPANFTLSRSEQRRLYTFVGRLCKVVGAPEPCRIDVDCQVNASASFREGLGGFLKGELVLTIGLPLAAGMTARELTGVLAHEFGHFAQGTGMRLTYVVRMVNAWFARVVYERDAWDEWLRDASRGDSHIAINLVAWLARGAVWLTRRILWVLMWTGHFISSFMLRQMEFDADRYEARVAGCEAFESTSARLSMLSVASNAAFSDLSEAWREKRLCDDLSKLIVAREETMPSEVRLAVRKHSGSQKTGWFDSHPSEADRIASVNVEKAPGIFHVTGPARMLFEDFDGLSRRATESFYRLNLGEHFNPKQVVATDAMVAETSAQQKSIDSMVNFFQGLVHPIRPVFPRREREIPMERDAAAEMIVNARTAMMSAVPAVSASAKDFEQADDRLINVLRVQMINRTGAPVSSAKLPDMGFTGLPTDDKLRDSARRQEIIREATTEKINRALNDAMIRVEIAITFAERERKAAVPKGPDNAGQEYGLAITADEDLVLTALMNFATAASKMERLRREYVGVESLLSLIKPDANPPQLVTLVLERVKILHGNLNDVHTILRATQYPYEHTERGATVSRFAVPEMPKSDDVGGVYRAAGSTLQAVYGLYMRLMGDLVRRAEEFETALGLEPLPAPKENKPAK